MSSLNDILMEDPVLRRLRQPGLVTSSVLFGARATMRVTDDAMRATSLFIRTTSRVQHRLLDTYESAEAVERWIVKGPPEPNPAPVMKLRDRSQS
jgi:hypothetical protein